MSESPAPTQSPPRSVARQIGRATFWSISILVVLLLLLMTIGPGLFELPFVLATGWLRFLTRTVPKVTWNWDLVGMGIVCAIVLVLLAQWFLNWIVMSVASTRGSTWRWPWKWTWCGLSTMMLFFLVGMAVGGAAHQIGWIVSSQKPWYERKGWAGEAINDMRQLDGAFQQALLESNGDVERACLALKNPHCEYLNQRSGDTLMLQKYHFLLILDGTNKVVGTILFPRDVQHRQRYRVMYSFGEQSEFFSMEKLPELLHKHQQHLFAM